LGVFLGYENQTVPKNEGKPDLPPLGSEKISTLPETSCVGSAPVVLVQLPVPLMTVQPPDSSKLIVKARAGANARVSPMPRAANATTASAIRFMIGIPLNRPRQPSRARRAAVAATQVNFVRHEPSLPPVIRADERRRGKAVRQSTRTAAWPQGPRRSGLYFELYA